MVFKLVWEMKHVLEHTLTSERVKWQGAILLEDGIIPHSYSQQITNTSTKLWHNKRSTWRFIGQLQTHLFLFVMLVLLQDNSSLTVYHTHNVTTTCCNAPCTVTYRGQRKEKYKNWQENIFASSLYFQPININIESVFVLLCKFPLEELKRAQIGKKFHTTNSSLPKALK